MNLPKIETIILMNYIFTFEKEKILKDKITSYLDANKTIKFSSINEIDILASIFNFKKKKFLNTLDLIFPRTDFLTWCLNYYLNKKKLDKKINKIDSTKLFIDLIGHCFKKNYNVCFIGTNLIEKDHLKRNFQFIFPKLSDIYFINNNQYYGQLLEIIEFLQKSKYKLLILSSKLKYYREKLMESLPQQAILFDHEALKIYSKNKMLKRDKTKIFKMLKLFVKFKDAFKFLLSEIFYLIPLRVIFLILIISIKFFRKKNNIK